MRMNFREALKRLALVVAGTGAVIAVVAGVSLSPKRSDIASTFLYSMAAEDADEMKTAASDVLRVYRDKLGSSDEEIIHRICASPDKNTERKTTCEIYASVYEDHWKKSLAHFAMTALAALGVAAAVMMAWKLFDWVLAGLFVNRSSP